MSIKTIKNERGIVLADAVVAVLILSLFTGFTVNLLYNIYWNSMFVKRNSTSTGYAIQIIEAAKIIDYSQILLQDDSKLKIKIDTILGISGAPTSNNDPETNKYEYIWNKQGYEILLRIESYKPSQETIDREFVKKVSVSVKYEVAKIEKSVNIETFIGK